MKITFLFINDANKKIIVPTFIAHFKGGSKLKFIEKPLKKKRKKMRLIPLTLYYCLFLGISVNLFKERNSFAVLTFTFEKVGHTLVGSCWLLS